MTRFVFLAILLSMLVGVSGVEAASLSWQDTATNESGFKIERMPAACTATPAFVAIGEVGQNVTSYVDATTQQGYAYCYRVRAWNLRILTDPESAQFSAWSNTAGIEYPLPAPVAPGQLQVAPGQ